MANILEGLASKLNFFGGLKKYWDNLPEEQKQAFVAAAVKAATKAMQSYAK